MVDRQHIIEWVNATRERDPDQTLTYHSCVLVSRKCICMTVPKNACSRIKLTLHLLEGHTPSEHIGNVHDKGLRLAAFDTTTIIEMLMSPDWFKFCFVRNPYNRLLSAYKTQVGNTWNEQYKWLKDDIKKALGYPPDRNGSERLVAFRDFVHYLRDAKDKLRHDGHFNIQTRILMPHVIPYDFVGRFETLQRDLEHVLKRVGAPPEIVATAYDVINPTYKLHPAIAYDRVLADTVFDLFKPDFDTFDYDRDSWMYEHSYHS
jgi:hypothetical protein